MMECLCSGFLAHSLLPVYKKRIGQARKYIIDALEKGNNPYIAFSTGKDSTVMADMVWRYSGSNIPAVYFDASACFPESLALLRRYENAGRNIILWKTEPILDIMERVGGPTSLKSEAATMRGTVYNPIRRLLSEYRFDLSFVGLRAEEGVNRMRAIRFRGPCFDSMRDGISVCWPIGWLTFRDIWAYIFSNDVDYCAVYDKQFEMGLDWEDCRLSYCYGETKHTQGRWAVLARGWPEIFNHFAQRFPEIRRFI